MKVINRFIVSLLALNVAACTWVDMSPEGEKVRVLTTTEVAACEHVGKTTVTTTAKLAGMRRHGRKVQAELNTLARNSAVELNGDTVVPVGEPKEGSQRFEIYQCMP